MEAIDCSNVGNFYVYTCVENPFINSASKMIFGYCLCSCSDARTCITKRRWYAISSFKIEIFADLYYGENGPTERDPCKTRIPELRITKILPGFDPATSPFQAQNFQLVLFQLNSK
ncbi:hypothetical protein SUGI_0031130 [Cryptomeria japonica]|nr:hypothetical protein SUGI_0031130 [Cryptomeria japonica]